MPGTNDVPFTTASVGVTVGVGWPAYTSSAGAETSAPDALRTDTVQVATPAFTWACVGGQAAAGSLAVNVAGRLKVAASAPLLSAVARIAVPLAASFGAALGGLDDRRERALEVDDDDLVGRQAGAGQGDRGRPRDHTGDRIHGPVVGAGRTGGRRRGGSEGGEGGDERDGTDDACRSNPPGHPHCSPSITRREQCLATPGRLSRKSRTFRRVSTASRRHFGPRFVTDGRCRTVPHRPGARRRGRRRRGVPRWRPGRPPRRHRVGPSPDVDRRRDVGGIDHRDVATGRSERGRPPRPARVQDRPGPTPVAPGPPARAAADLAARSPGPPAARGRRGPRRSRPLCCRKEP